MAARKSTKPAVLDTELDEVESETTAELTPKQIINEGIGRFLEATGIDVQKNRYKAMRAIAYQAFVNSIDEGSFDDLVTSAIDNVDSLPAGWEIERTAKAETAPVAKKAAAKPAAKKPATKAAPAKAATARKRPTR